MFEEILHYHKQNENLSDTTVYNLRQVARHYDGITNDTRKKLIQIKGKYNFRSRENIFPIPTNDTHLEFWRGSGDFDVSVALADKTGVYDADKEFGIVAKAWPYEGLIPNEDKEEEKYFKIASNMFYAWFGYNWQMVDGNEAQLSVKIIENNSSSLFSLNDFAWYDLSKFNKFKESPEPRNRHFIRKLKFIEVYSRADLKYSFLDVPEHERRFIKEGRLKNLKLKRTEITVSDFSSAEDKSPVQITYPETDVRKLQLLYIDKINDLINEDWMDCTFQL